MRMLDCASLFSAKIGRLTRESGGDRNIDDFYIGEMKRRLHRRKTEHFKALKKSCQACISHGGSYYFNFKILVTGRSDIESRI